MGFYRGGEKDGDASQAERGRGRARVPTELATRLHDLTRQLPLERRIGGRARLIPLHHIDDLVQARRNPEPVRDPKQPELTHIVREPHERRGPAPEPDHLRPHQAPTRHTLAPPNGPPPQPPIP